LINVAVAVIVSANFRENAGMPQTTDINVRNIKVKVHKAGKGPPLLFLHGAGGFLWTPFFDALAETHEVIVPEHPGFGASDDPELIRSIPDMAMFYLDFADALSLQGAHLVGHSMGGWIAAEILIRNQARFRSLTLISPAGLRVDGVQAGDLFIWTPQELTRNLFHDQALAEQVLAIPVSDEQMNVLLKNRFTVAKLAWQPRWFNPDLGKWLHRITVPSLLIWGKEDKIMPAAFAKAWQENLSGVRIVTFDNCGHIPQAEKAADTTRQIKAFLSEVAR
jgi:pimeloyl-ACP methyl ester carboxylesterase